MAYSLGVDIPPSGGYSLQVNEDNVGLISKYRLNKGWSLADLAEKLEESGRKVSTQLIHYWETEKRRPYEDDIRLVGRILEIPEKEVALMCDHVAKARRTSRQLRAA